MDKSVSAAEANRNFSRILRAVKAGETYLVTSHGTPVARIVPARTNSEEKTAAKERLLSRLRAQPVQVIGKRWNRDSLYDD